MCPIGFICVTDAAYVFILCAVIGCILILMPDNEKKKPPTVDDLRAKWKGKIPPGSGRP